MTFYVDLAITPNIRFGIPLTSNRSKSVLEKVFIIKYLCGDSFKKTLDKKQIFKG